jgi:hypothetical protein
VQLALAGFEKDESQADFLRLYLLGRVPNYAKLRQRAAEFLRKQGKEDLVARSGSAGAISTPNNSRSHKSK